MAGSPRAVLAAGSLVVALWALALMPGSAGAAGCTDEFSGPSGASWSEASNWSAGVPGASSVVCWDAAKTVVVGEGTQSADSIAHGGSLLIEGSARLGLGSSGAGVSALSGALHTRESGALELQGRLACSGATLAGGAIVDDGVLECPLILTGGTLSGTGSAAAVANEDGNVEPGDGTAPGGLVVGPYSQGSGGTLSVRQDASGGGVNDHLLRASGPVTLAGTISLGPASPAAGFLVLATGSEPNGYFAQVRAPAQGSPWTVEYGPEGAAALSGQVAALVPRVTGAAQPGGTLTCGPGYPREGPQWQPRGIGTYGWGTREVHDVLGWTPPPRDVESIEFPEPVREGLEQELRADTASTLVVPGAAIGRNLDCQLRIATPAGGSASPVWVDPGDSNWVAIDGPFHHGRGPLISGRPIPGGRLTCAPGSWEGTPSSYSYSWVRGPQQVSTSPAFKLGSLDQGRFTCIVTAHYGAIAVPAEASVEVPAPPEPTLCARAQVALVSARSAGGRVLLFGAAVPRYFGERVFALRRSSPHSPWRRVASARVNGSGYFEFHIRSRPGASRGDYRVQVGHVASNAVTLPGVLQIASDNSHGGESFVDLRLSPTAQRSGEVTVSPLNKECAGTGPAVATARLAPGGDLRLRLTAAREQGPGYYLASAKLGTKTYSVELIVPAIRPKRFPR